MTINIIATNKTINIPGNVIIS